MAAFDLAHWPSLSSRGAIGGSAHGAGVEFREPGVQEVAPGGEPLDLGRERRHALIEFLDYAGEIWRGARQGGVADSAGPLDLEPGPRALAAHLLRIDLDDADYEIVARDHASPILF